MDEGLTVLIPGDHEHLNAFDTFVLDEGIHEGVAIGFLWDEIDLEVVFFDLACSGCTNCGDAHRAEAADVVECFIEDVEEGLHAIDAGEDDPLIDRDAREYFSD